MIGIVRWYPAPLSVGGLLVCLCTWEGVLSSPFTNHKDALSASHTKTWVHDHFFLRFLIGREPHNIIQTHNNVMWITLNGIFPIYQYERGNVL